MANNLPRRAAVLGGNRIPFARQFGPYAEASNQDMFTAALDGLVARYNLGGKHLDEVVGGAVIKHSRDFNLTRESVLGSALAPTTSAYDLQQACGTGLEAAVLVSNKIKLGQIESGVAGGVDTASDAPITVTESLRKKLLKVNRAKGAKNQALALSKIRPTDFGIATPGGPDAVASSVVNARLNPGVPASEVLAAAEPRIAAGGAMTSEALLTHLAQGTADGFTAVSATEPMVAAATATGSEGLSFISPDGSPALSAPMVAFTSGGPIDETNARAAAEFVEFAREDGGVDAAEPGDDSAAASPLDGAAGELLPEIAARQTNPAAGAATDVPESAAGEPGAERGDDAGSDRAAPADDAAATEPAGSTLVLLDTSEGMDLDAVRGALTPLLDRAIDGEGRRVALWNYSSPMSEGVISPVRPNVRFGAGAKDRSAEVLAQLGTGGEPWLWRSVGPAVDYVAETHSAGVANRVVLVTTGADATGDDAGAAIDRIAAAAGTDRPVRVDVVIVGEDATGGDLAALASATGGSVRVAGEDLTAALVAAMGL